ncbi:zinc finger and BTB domain-containing protein 24 [Pseudoliparis swirei]|uniref:zinc finger and BTB domain-containing protein 24 n=1 Tax=Pseudoliparis swirei TaxID=2059687 RepID=UPI0024BEF7A9|nr:zinc finger and BTB domain-containing protein 24 [Pseudoliparis swirei]XP_056281673.1 zinc finger and BTB domain-containing protein 24 [Pseudoliparis swirei]
MTSSPMALHSEAHKQSILSKFDALRKRELLCDITLVVEDVHYKAHKALLAASSDYFSLMFTAEDRIGPSTYRLDGMAAQMFAAVLDFIYSAQVSVEESATEQLLATARLMEVNDLVRVLATLSPSRRGEAEPHPSKCKRGRPKKNVAATALEGGSATCESSEERLAGRVDRDDDDGDDDGDGGVSESPAKNDANCTSGSNQSRKSKRKVRPPVKYKSYKVGIDTLGGEEPGKRGRKRKYPDTEPRCEDCGKVFKNHLFLKIHQRTHTGEKPFRCQVCAKAFTQKHTLLVHQRMHTGEKPFVCSVCSKALSTKHALQEHMDLHQGGKSFSCDKCGKTFTQKRQLKSHYRVHTGKSLPECAQCRHKFMDTAQLKKHLRTHTGEKPFTCEICGKCFTAKSTLQTHIRIHRGEKPYDCSVCNKSFSDPSARRRHVASHSGRKPFTCSFCSLSFTRLDNLKTHTKSHNKERAGDASEEEEARGVLQPYQLPSGGGQEIQLVVTGDVDDMDFVPVQNQEIGIVATDSAHSRLALLAQSAHQNAALVARGAAADRSPPMQALGMLEGHVTQQQPEHMHVITLSKEAMEHLQAHHGPPRPVQQLQVVHGPVQHLAVTQGPVSRGPHGQTSELISSHHIQGQTFQIQAGSVSYLYSTGQES